MHIALNSIMLLSPLTGIGHYNYQLAKNLQALPGVSLDFFYGNNWSKELREKHIPGIVTIKSAVKRFIPNSYVISRYLQQRAFNKLATANIYHEPNFLPLQFNGPTVVTVHDLSWIRYPATHSIEKIKNMHRYFEPGLRRSQMIITDSIFVKQELIDVFGVNESKIKTVLLGSEAIFSPKNAEDTKHVLAKHSLTHGGYILSIGTLEPRKNIQATLEAYMQLPAATRRSFPLVIVGMKGWNFAQIEKQITRLLSTGEIRLMGYLPREELALLTAGALTLIYPSIYEGFGLPPLEAMACGVPVIASNTSSLPEVVGDTGFLIDPYDINAITTSLQTFIEAPEIRQNYAEKAYARSLTFSWHKCALETLQVYKEAICQ